MAQTCAGRTAVVIPAYKPDDRLPPYVQALKDAGIGRIVVVDDGSTDRTAVAVLDCMPGTKGLRLLFALQ